MIREFLTTAAFLSRRGNLWHLLDFFEVTREVIKAGTIADQQALDQIYDTATAISRKLAAAIPVPAAPGT